VVDAICALPHPVPTNAIAASLCMSHLLTGSDDGYIRNYDIFTACNGKNFLSAPQRSHCGFVEGVIKAGVLRSWWESTPPPPAESIEAISKESVHSLLAQSDSLWGLSGLEVSLTGCIATCILILISVAISIYLLSAMTRAGSSILLPATRVLSGAWPCLRMRKAFSVRDGMAKSW
jgi:hypothetical protein